MRTVLWLAASVVVALTVCPIASAAVVDEDALAQRYAPVVRLVQQLEECGPGEPYEPMDVDLLFNEPTVAFRGPWNAFDLVKIGPTANDLVGRYEYHLDFPGDALSPGCDYERWGRRLTEGRAPAVYAHVATDPTQPGKLALQYWFFYVFNDWNNLHEGDWEMVQLVFDTSDPREALGRDPESIGYSSHEGAERADWGEDKLEIVDATHPVVYPAAGSHANKFTDALYLGSSAEQGVGCDDTRGPHTELRPTVKTIPSEPEAARAEFPWIAFEGRWGELQEAFFNGPTGPNLKRQWTEPIQWADGWRDRSYAVPTGGLFGTSATDFFCTAVERGSRSLVQLLRDPVVTLLAFGTLLGLFILVAVRATWTPVAPLRLARRRTWGQILSAAGRMYVRRAPLFLGIGVLLIPLSILIAVLHSLLLGGLGFFGVDTTGEAAGALALLLLAIGTTVTLLGLALVQAATACALVRLDRSESIGPLDAYRITLRRFRPLLRTLAIAVVVWVVLTTTAVLIPIAVWLAVRWALLAQVVELDERAGLAALRRSAELVRRRWFRVGTLVVLGAAVALAAGPLIGAVLIFLTDFPLPLLNVVAGVVYALALPFVGLVTSYVYFDARTRLELEPAEPEELPAEIQLST